MKGSAKWRRHLLGTALAVVAGLMVAPASAFELEILGNATFSPENPTPEVAAVYKQAWDAFLAENPDVTIRFDKSAGSPDAVQEILTKVGSGRVVDMGIVETSWLARLHAADFLKPMDDVLTDEAKADFLPGVLEAASRDGHLRGIQLYNSWRGVYYRPTEVQALGYEQPPTVWNDFLEFGQKALDAGYQSAVMFPATKSELTMLYMMPQYFGLGGELFDETGKPVFFESPYKEKLAEVMSMWRELVARGMMPVTAGAQDEAAQRPFFYAKQTATIGNATSFTNQFYADQPDLKGNLSVVPLPLPDGNTPVPMIAGWAYVLLTEDPERREVAKRFIQHLTKPEVMASFNAIQGHLPIRHSIWKTEPTFSEDALMQKIYQIHLSAPMRLAGGSPIYPATREAISGQMAEVIAGTITPEEAIERAKVDVVAAYDRLTNR